MATAPALRRVMPALSKIGLWMGISAVTTHLTGNPELASTLAAIGVGQSNLDGACKLIDSLASNRLSDYYKDFRSSASFGINHHLQQALQEGIANALSELKTTFVADNPLSQYEEQQAEFYFRSLTHHLGKEMKSDSQIDDYVLDRAAFFADLLKTVHALPDDDTDINQTDEGVLTPDLSEPIAQRLIAFLVEQIEPVAQRYINEEFKTNDKAKTAYFIHLLESGARINQDNNAILLQVSSTLDEVGRRQQEHTDLLRQIAQAQQLIHESLRKLQVDFRAYVSDFDSFRERVENRFEPSLTLPDYHNLPESFSYQYGLRYTSFISRDDEISQLWDFLNGQPDRRMLWWLVTGPGGMGKNRLALEFCLQAQCVNRYVGFVESQHITGFDWSQWQPAHPTLLVVDYVAMHAVPTQQMIAQLSRNAQQDKRLKKVTKPVRVLLLERETRDDWWGPFLADRDVVESSYVAGNPRRILDLRPFTDDDRWQVITELHRKQGKSLPVNKADTLRSLTEIDPEGRPLFAFLAGVALAEGEDIRRWDVHDLLNNLLQREENSIWKTHPKWQDERCREGHKNLLVLTTLTRGLTTMQLRNLFAQNLEWFPLQKPDNSLYERLSNIRERTLLADRTEKVYEGLQPDIVGEYYVLKRIGQLLRDHFTGDEISQALLQIAWDISSGETWWSLWRALSDFSQFPDTRVCQYLQQSRPTADSPETSWENWASLQYNLAHPESYLADKKSAYQRLRALAKAYPHNEEIVLPQAKGAMNLTNYYGTAQQWEQAQACYADLQALAKAYPHNEEIGLATV